MAPSLVGFGVAQRVQKNKSSKIIAITIKTKINILSMSERPKGCEKNGRYTRSASKWEPSNSKSVGDLLESLDPAGYDSCPINRRLSSALTELVDGRSSDCHGWGGEEFPPGG